MVVNIMNSYRYIYEGWVLRKFSFWNDLLVFDFQNKILVYIDNIVDGYIYSYELQKWWDVFCYIYFECINKRNLVWFFIIVKDDVIEKVCVYIDVNILVLEKMFFVRVDLYFLMFD